MAQEVVEEQVTEIPEDYAAFTAFRDGGGGKPDPDDEAEKPSAGEEKTPTSELARKASQIAEESDTADDPQQEEAEEEDESEKPAHGESGKGLAKRMRQMAGKIKALESQRAAREEIPDTAGEEAEAEVVSATDQDEEAEAPLVRPMLKDFEDTDELTAWDQYEAAMESYNDAKTLKHVESALAKQAQELELKHAKATAEAEWTKAASRFSDYNDVVTKSDVKISSAMESVMKMDPTAGTELAYYLGQHPEESEKIAKLTLASSEKEWPAALARAGIELGRISAKLTPPGTKPAAPKTPVAATKPALKQVTSASRPPTTIRGGTAPPTTDVTDEDDAADYKKWRQAREAQIKRK